MKHGLLLALALFSGCATCQEHRAICTAVAVGLVAGTVAARQDGRRDGLPAGAVPAICRVKPESCK